MSPRPRTCWYMFTITIVRVYLWLTIHVIVRLSLSLSYVHPGYTYTMKQRMYILGPRDPLLTFLMSDTGARFVGSALGAAIAETAARTSHRGWEKDSEQERLSKTAMQWT